VRYKATKRAEAMPSRAARALLPYGRAGALARNIAARKWAIRLRGAVWKTVLWPARLAVAVIVRWPANILHTIVGDRGWVTVGSIVGAYLVIFGLVDAKHQREENQASLERAAFITLVSSGNAASFVVGLKSFGPVQTMQATAEPSLFKPWT